MKAITLWQPWASAIACGVKRIETRSWSTSYRGPIAIHAAKKWDDGLAAAYCRLYDEFSEFAAALAKTPPHFSSELIFGAVIATANLTACKPTVQFINHVSPMEKAFGNYLDGRFGWELTEIKALERPIPARGRQQLWEWSEVPA